MKNLLSIICLGSVLTSCSCTDHRRPVVYDDYNQTTTVVDPGYQHQTVIHEHHDNSGSNFLAGALVGHALSNSGNSGGYSKRVKKTTIINNNYHAPTRVVGSTRSASRSYSAPSRSSSSFYSRARSSSSMSSRISRRR